MCRLRFSDGPHELRVTDAVVHFGNGAHHAGRVGRVPVLDVSSALVEVGGDDMTSGMHAIHTFSGSLVRPASSETLCEEQRAKHIARVPCALQGDDGIPLGGPGKGERPDPASVDDGPPGVPSAPMTQETTPPTRCSWTAETERNDGYCPTE